MRTQRSAELLKADFLKLREQGYSYRAIAQRFGLGRESVRTACLSEDQSVTVYREGRALLRKVPRWWTKSAEEYRQCVKANFGL